jgi:BolA protein
MSTADKIHEILTKHLAPKTLEVLDESGAHAGHGAKGGHYAVFIISEVFRGLKTIDRHRKIHALIDPSLKDAVHALRIRALTPEEPA